VPAFFSDSPGGTSLFNATDASTRILRCRPLLRAEGRLRGGRARRWARRLHVRRRSRRISLLVDVPASCRLTRARDPSAARREDGGADHSCLGGGDLCAIACTSRGHGHAYLAMILGARDDRDLVAGIFDLIFHARSRPIAEARVNPDNARNPKGRTRSPPRPVGLPKSFLQTRPLSPPIARPLRHRFCNATSHPTRLLANDLPSPSLPRANGPVRRR